MVPGQVLGLVRAIPFSVKPGAGIRAIIKLEHDAQGEIVTLMNIFAYFRVYKECRFSFGGTQ